MFAFDEKFTWIKQGRAGLVWNLGAILALWSWFSQSGSASFFQLCSAPRERSWQGRRDSSLGVWQSFLRSRQEAAGDRETSKA